MPGSSFESGSSVTAAASHSAEPTASAIDLNKDDKTTKTTSSAPAPTDDSDVDDGSDCTEEDY
jgi:hypothetical protein